ncbi:circadian clock protein KaiC [bacterium]|nr:MAG: circadian clock protein KaiC [bacterium]
MAESGRVMRRQEGKASTGIDGLNNILGGGLPIGHLYLLEGEPGSGKTTLAIQFLLEGAALGEKVLYITLSETADELRYAAESHGWDLSSVELMELDTFLASQKPESQYTVFSASEVELGDTLRMIREAVERVKPTRVVLDSLSEMRLLSRDSLRFRREILGFKQFFAASGATVLFLDDRTTDPEDRQLHSIAHGIILLERLSTEFGSERRRLIVSKLRANLFRGGFHDYRIVTGGLVVYPRLSAAEHRQGKLPGSLLSGVGNLDDLLGGGLDRGTSTMIMGPVGSGKSTIVAMYALAAAEQGERAAIYLFDENEGTLLTRCRALDMPLDQYLETGAVTLQQIDPAEMSPGELVQLIRDGVEKQGIQHVIIDSVSGFINAMPEERLLTVQLHELLTYLGQKGVVTLLAMPQHGMMGVNMASQADLSYLADSVILLRYFEAFGAVRQAISVVKRRTGKHERTIREMQIGSGGVIVGNILQEFQGVLTGVPRYVGNQGPLLGADLDES